MSYTRTGGAPQAGRDSSTPHFHMEAVLDEAASAANGRPSFREEERVQIIQPGNPNSPVFLVSDEYRQRWPEQYSQFKAGQEQTTKGVPLEQWPFLKKMHVLELKAKNIHTVEQCAELSDLACQGLGIGGRSIRENARAYLDDAAAMSIVSQAIADREAAESKNAALQMQIDEMRPMLDSMHRELMMLKNAPSAVATHVPGDHDPFVQSRGVQPPLPPGESSLDGLAPPRPRGRPPGSTNKPREEAA